MTICDRGRWIVEESLCVSAEARPAGQTAGKPDSCIGDATEGDLAPARTGNRDGGYGREANTRALGISCGPEPEP